MGTVTEVVGGGTPSTKVHSHFLPSGTGQPWITPADLSGFSGAYIERGCRDLSEDGLQSSSARVMPKGSVLMSSRAPIGYTAIAANPIATNQGFKSFVCQEAVLPEYVLYWLRWIRPLLEGIGSGSTFAEISGTRAKEIPILLAPLPEQRRIVAKVEALLSKVSAARGRLANAPRIVRRFRQSVLAAACSGKLTEDWRCQHPNLETAADLVRRIRDNQQLESRVDRSPRIRVKGKQPRDGIKEGQSDIAELFGQNGENIPQDWCWATLDQIYAIKYGLSEPLRKLAPDNRDDMPIVSMANVTEWGALNLTGLRYFPVSPVERVKLLLRRGDLLFNWRNAPKWIGKTAIFDLDEPYVNASFLLRLRPLSPADHAPFAWIYLNYLRSAGYFELVSRAAVNQSNFNASEVGRLAMPLPPLAEQREVVRRVDVLFNLAEAIENRIAAALERIEKVAQVILAKVFKGELVPTEAALAREEGRDYEPASVLLERIAQERGQAGAPSGTRRTSQAPPTTDRRTSRRVQQRQS